MEAKTIAILLFLAAAGLAASNYLAIFADNTVTVTETSPAIQINTIQYKYEYFPFKHTGTIPSPLQSGNIVYPDGRERASYEQLIGRWHGHKLVVNYEFVMKEYASVGVRVIDAYYDGQYIPGLATEQYTPYAPLVHGESCQDLNRHFIGEYDEFIWVNVDGTLVKFIINSRNPSNIPWSIDENGCYIDEASRGLDDVCRTGSCKMDYVITASIYVPASEFEAAYCGDGNCDLTESCETCEQDCGVCVVPDCGDGVCGSQENYFVCPADCEPEDPFCGDGFCNGQENCLTCTQDCGECGDFHCGDGACNANETCVTCDQDCGVCPSVCGNGACESGESSTNCPIDCGMPTGDTAVTTEEIQQGQQSETEVVETKTDYTWYIVAALIILALLILIVRKKR